jgi:aspartate aminotransferase-like enzyme
MQVPDAVAAAAGKPLFFHRSPRFTQFQASLRKRVGPLFGTTRAEILFLSSCGTGAMESAVVNLTSPAEEVIVMVGGVFAERWVAIGKAYGLDVHAVEVDWRAGAAIDDVTRAMDRWPGARVVFVTWSESSTGVLIDLEGMGAAVRDRNKFLVADAVSGLAVSRLDMDDWQVDTVVSGSQKGLMMPPGLGLVAVGPRALEHSRSCRSPRFTWDWASYLEKVPVTPPLSLMHQLNAALDLMDAMGEGGLYRRRREVANTIRDLVRDAGLELYAKNCGDGITAVVVPHGMDTARFQHRLEDEYSILIEGGPGRLSGKILRIGHVGHLTDEELQYFCESFPKALAAELGH